MGWRWKRNTALGTGRILPVRRHIRGPEASASVHLGLPQLLAREPANGLGSVPANLAQTDVEAVVAASI